MTENMGVQIVLAARPKGAVRLSDFQLKEFSIPTISAGKLLLEVNYLSLDPYMRGRMDDRKSYAEPAKVGDVMPGETISTVIASQHPEFATGDLVLAYTGWCTHAVIEPEKVRRTTQRAIPITTQLGVLGMPGFTAYAGLKEIGRPVKGETVVVAAASGPVGSLVGQLAKLDGARAIGIAGGPVKCAYVKDELLFDAVVDHRSPDFWRALQAACPDGIDVYYENVGGAVWQAVLPLLNRFARVPVCGIISYYDSSSHTPGPDLLPETMRLILSQRLRIQGFLNFDYKDKRYDEFQREVSQGITDGLIKYREDVVDGLENAPKALLGLLEGKNFGKLLIRVREPHLTIDTAKSR
jgi:NADPH-dependent curcumin reductase CurA